MYLCTALLRVLERLERTDYSYNGLAAALGSARQWRQVLALVDHMAGQRLDLDSRMRLATVKKLNVHTHIYI